MSILSKLFGGSSASPKVTSPTEYEGFTITPEPIKEGSKYRVGAKIEKTIDGETKTHHLIRADLLDSHDDGVEASLRKARQMVDEQGERLFG